MRKFPVIAFAAFSLFSTSSFAAARLSGSPVQVQADVTVGTTSTLNANWLPVTNLPAGLSQSGTRVGSLTVTGLGSSDAGWVVYADGSTGEHTNAITKYKFTHESGRNSFYALISDKTYPGVSYGSGAGIGTGPATFISSNITAVDFVTNTQNNLTAGVYSATLSVSAYNN
ncbi:hypothetical protein F9I95_23100 [Escherichia coli]|nr:hypothetical protein [Escherichia coli]